MHVETKEVTTLHVFLLINTGTAVNPPSHFTIIRQMLLLKHGLLAVNRSHNVKCPFQLIDVQAIYLLLFILSMLVCRIDFCHADIFDEQTMSRQNRLNSKKHNYYN